MLIGRVCETGQLEQDSLVRCNNSLCNLQSESIIDFNCEWTVDCSLQLSALQILLNLCYFSRSTRNLPKFD